MDDQNRFSPTPMVQFISSIPASQRTLRSIGDPIFWPLDGCLTTKILPSVRIFFFQVILIYTLWKSLYLCWLSWHIIHELEISVKIHPKFLGVAGPGPAINDRGPRASLRKRHGGRLPAQRGQFPRATGKNATGNPKEKWWFLAGKISNEGGLDWLFVFFPIGGISSDNK